MLLLPEGFEVASTVALPFFKNAVFNIGWLFVPFVALLAGRILECCQSDRWTRRTGDRRRV